jgi:hypothetical protein
LDTPSQLAKNPSVQAWAPLCALAYIAALVFVRSPWQMWNDSERKIASHLEHLRPKVGRNLKHLITLLEDLQALGIAFVSLAEGIDATTPAGKLQMHILGAIAEFERGRITERIMAGLQRARAQGVRLGRPPRRIDPTCLAAVVGLPEREAARRLGIPRSTLQRFRALNGTS